MAQHRLTVDTGGTFSDFVYVNEATSEITVAKVPSTPDDPSRAILAGVETLVARGVAPNDIRYFCHGTTVGTNALLEGKGVRTGLLVTKGFRGIYEVAEQSRPHGPVIFDIMYDRPAKLVPPSRTGEVAERVSFEGEILEGARRGSAAADAAGVACGRRRVRSRYVCCSRFSHPGTKSACAPSSPKRSPAVAYRCRARSCRRFANIIGCPRPP